MKRVFIVAIVFFVTAAFAAAQDLYTTNDVGDNFYYGSARTMALGNAVTAVGGDLGSVTVNPAGSAVNNYSQVSLTPGLDISSTHASYAPTFNTKTGLTDSDFISGADASSTKFIFPHGGFMFDISTGMVRGLKAVSVGFVASASNSYVDKWAVSGMNDGYSSLTGWMAYKADGFPESRYLADDAYSDYELNYFAVMAVRSKAANVYDGSANTYMGAAEIEKGGMLVPCGKLYQSPSVNTYGNKTDLAFNVGFNIDDCLYFGINLAFPILSYKYNESMVESSSSLETDFQSSSYNYSLSRNGSGFYGKFGVIWLPFNGLRVGMSFQTPAKFRINDQYSLDGYTISKSGLTSGSSYGYRNNAYHLTSPYRFSFGAAYSLGRYALLSADYEFADFGVTKYTTTSGNESVFNQENLANQLFLGFQHQFRAGLEIKPLPSVALRLGYNLLTGSMYYYKNSRYYTSYGDLYASDFNYYDYQRGFISLGEKTLVPEYRHSFSIGGGYSSKGSFFADIALRYTTYPKRNYVVYGDYLYTDNVLTTPSPTVRFSRGLWDLALTIGFRF